MHKFKGKPLSITHLDCEFHEGDTDRTYISRSSEDEEMLKDNTKIKRRDDRREKNADSEGRQQVINLWRRSNNTHHKYTCRVMFNLNPQCVS